jgi:hypothetical protein
MNNVVVQRLFNASKFDPPMFHNLSFLQLVGSQLTFIIASSSSIVRSNQLFLLVLLPRIHSKFLNVGSFELLIIMDFEGRRMSYTLNLFFKGQE